MDRDRFAALRLGVLRVLPSALAVAVHAPALLAGFVHDDLPQIRDNPLLQSLGTLTVLWSTGVWAGAGLAAGVGVALHPVNTEAAAWISARPDVL